MKMVVQIETDSRNRVHINLSVTYGITTVRKTGTCSLDQASATLKNMIDRWNAEGDTND